MESTLDFEATRISQLKTKQRIGLQNKTEQTYDRPISCHVSVGKISYVILEFPPMNSRNFLVMQSGVGDTGSHNIYHKTNKPYTPTVSIRQHITKKTSEIMYLNLRKASIIRAIAILPNSLPVLGGVEVILPLAA